MGSSIVENGLGTNVRKTAYMYLGSHTDGSVNVDEPVGKLTSFYICESKSPVK